MLTFILGYLDVSKRLSYSLFNFSRRTDNSTSFPGKIGSKLIISNFEIKKLKNILNGLPIIKVSFKLYTLKSDSLERIANRNNSFILSYLLLI